MPMVKGEHLYSTQGPNNSAVLMDIISKQKQDLKKSRAENGKLIDQLNCLISLVKRSWSGDEGATMHLGNIVGVVPPQFDSSSMPRNTPVPEKTKATEHWERLAVRLLERDYRAIQQQIYEQQRLYIQNRKMYMDEVLHDHQSEMSRFSLHRQKSASNVEEVDKKFLRCYSAKPGRGGSRRTPTGGLRPKSAFVSRPKTASEMVDGADMTVEDLLVPGSRVHLKHNASNKVMTTAYKMSKEDYHDNRTYDDPNRYRNANLFDPDVIFGEKMVTKNGETTAKTRPTSAILHERPKSGTKSSAFMTERPLKYETTRPVSGVSGRPKSGIVNRTRRNSAPVNKDRTYSVIHKKTAQESDQNLEDHTSRINANTNNTSDHEAREAAVDDKTVKADNKPQIRVKVKKTDPVDTFVNELRQMEEMEKDFKKSAVDLQKKLGIDTNGFVY